MKLASGKTTLWCVATLLSVVVAFGQGGAANAAGAAILQRACAGCHAPDVIANYHYEKAEEYREMVNTMIAAGAQVSTQELPVLVDYLFATYGKKPAAGAAAATDPGKAILEAACTTCHDLEGLKNHVYTSKDQYEAIVKSMVAYGATVSEAQMPALVDYMFKTYGKK
jgi:mono/diheme cytochrome c family protein